MKFTCSKEKLLMGINIVQKAVPTKTTLPILEGILICAGEILKLTGNDLELAIEYYVKANILDEGAIVINSKIFGDIIRKMPDSDILIEVQDNNIVFIESENTYFKIKGLPPAGFPAIPNIEKTDKFEIKKKVIKDMIKHTIFAAGADESLPIFTGMLVECRKDEISIVAADRVARMALYISVIEDCNFEFKAIIPAKTLNEISKILDMDDNRVTMYMNNNQVLFCTDNCRVLSRLLDGEYFNYRSIIRQDYETKVVINKKEMLLGIERSMLISLGQKKHPIIFDINDNRLTISCNTEFGEITDELKVEMTGKYMKIGFNPALFVEPLRVIEDEYVEVLFATNLGPATIRPVKGNKFTYVVGAMRI